jgi:hypothetical protein
VAKLGGAGRVLYTDCDVIFVGEVVPELKANPCRYFAVAPESAQDDYVNMNTGVMLMNTDRLRESLPKFRQYVSENLADLERESWDEAAYRWYYRDENGPLWDRLRPELNWKPYWGESTEAKIIHFHGPKPFQRDYIDSHWPELRSLTGGAFPTAGGTMDPVVTRSSLGALFVLVRLCSLPRQICPKDYLSATANRCTFTGMSSRVFTGCSP